MRRRANGVAVTVLAGLAVAGVAMPATGAAAPTISTGAACLRPAQAATGQLTSPALVVRGTGFTPGGKVVVRRDLRETAGFADAAGSFRASVSVIDLVDSVVPQVRTVSVTAVDSATGAVTAPALRVRVAPLAFTATPQRAAPRALVTFRFSGFPPGRVIHAHYLLGGRVRANVPMVRAQGPCGTASVRRRQFPMARPSVGRWEVQFDTRRGHSPTARPRIGATIEVYPAGR